MRQALPSELSLAEDNGHERHVGRDAERAQHEDEPRLRTTAWVALEQARGVQRGVTGGAGTEPQVGADHRHGGTCRRQTNTTHLI